jgi:hypothetical protein
MLGVPHHIWEKGTGSSQDVQSFTTMPRLISLKQKLLQILALELRLDISQKPLFDEQLQKSVGIRMLQLVGES